MRDLIPGWRLVPKQATRAQLKALEQCLSPKHRPKKPVWFSVKEKHAYRYGVAVKHAPAPTKPPFLDRVKICGRILLWK